jgi:bacterioferritin
VRARPPLGLRCARPAHSRTAYQEVKMKGDAKVIDELNARLAEELTAINQYFVHAEMCEDWHYGRLAESIKKRSITEMKHAESLIERILFLDGRPIVSELNQMHIAATVPDMHANDLAAELDAVKAYNESIRVCVEQKDDGSKELLESILVDEEDHVDWLEAQLAQIEQVGREIYLAEQIG